MFNGIPFNSHNNLAHFSRRGNRSEGSVRLFPASPTDKVHSWDLKRWLMVSIAKGLRGGSLRPDCLIPVQNAGSDTWASFLTLCLSLLICKMEHTLQRAVVRTSELTFRKCWLQCAAHGQHSLHSYLTSKPMLLLPHQGLMLWSVQIKPLKHFVTALHMVSYKYKFIKRVHSSFRCSIPEGGVRVGKQASKDTELGPTKEITSTLELPANGKSSWSQEDLSQRWRLSGDCTGQMRTATLVGEGRTGG